MLNQGIIKTKHEHVRYFNLISILSVTNTNHSKNSPFLISCLGFLKADLVLKDTCKLI